MPPICGTVTWLSSTKTMALSGTYSNSVGGGFAGTAPGQIARIVLDAGTGAGRLKHFEVEARALLQPLGLQQAARLLQLDEPVLQLFLDRLDRLVERRGAG